MMNPIRFCYLTLILAIVFFRPVLAAANVGEIPDTPAGRQLSKLLIAFESDEHEKYITENFSQSFLDAFPLTQHQNFFRQVHVMHGGFTFHEIEKSSEHELVAILKSKKRDAWRRLSIQVDATSPYNIFGMNIERASSPDVEKMIQKNLSEAEVLKYVQDELKRRTLEDQFSGAILIAKNGKPLLKQAYGLASKEFDVPNKVDTKFNIGSINKSFTQMAIAQLFEQDKIELDDKIGQYLDELPAEWTKISIRHLLSMRSGMTSYWNEEWQAKWPTIKTVDALLDIIKKIPLDFEPGTQQRYSNSGYVVLGAIIEKVTGQSYYEYVRENIFEPAGMDNTDSYELDQIVANLAIGYSRNRSKTPHANNKFQNNLFIHSIKGSPAGGGYSTLDDLNRYVEALKENKLAGEKYTNMVLGLFQNGDANERPKGFGIAGGAPVGINAVIEADFERGYTVIVLSNYDPPFAEEFGSQIFQMLLKKST